MRFTVSFKAQEIPLGYRMMMVSIIKEALITADKQYYQDFFENKKDKMKPFSSAVFLRNFKMHNKTIKLDELDFTISSPDQEFMLRLYNGLIQLKQIQYQGFKLQRKKIRPIQEKVIRSNSVLFRTFSPILIENKEGKPIAPYDSSYKENVNYFADLILTNYRGKGLKKELDVRVGKMNKQVIKERLQEDKDNYLFFTAYKGLLLISGDPTDLQLLYQLGLSKRKSQGFGLIEVEREEV